MESVTLQDTLLFWGGFLLFLGYLILRDKGKVG
jgi:hypothetical protein